MAYTTIDDPGLYFNTVLYSGTGSSNSVTGVGFQPDWTWIKSRNNTRNHNVYDSVRGTTKVIYTDLNDAESTQSSGLTAFNSDGFTVVSDLGVNGASDNYASWNWLAGGSASSNSDGDITSSVSANQTAGFSIVTYTASSTATDTVGHGLGAKPNLIIVKEINGTNQWCVAFPDVLNNNQVLQLNLTNAVFADSAAFNDTVNTGTTSSVFVTGNGGLTGSNGQNYVAYCFAPKQGYSKFGSYKGNGNADGPFIYTGFKPAFVIMKNTADGGASWQLFDNKRNTFNQMNGRLFPNLSNAESTDANNNIDFLSNGFKMRTSNGDTNSSGVTFIYMAFAESPFVNSNKVPNNAR
jgi:hypothetical protein